MISPFAQHKGQAIVFNAKSVPTRVAIILNVEPRQADPLLMSRTVLFPRIVLCCSGGIHAERH
jgi:hypothetical protein